jgi:hypothetical protein
MASREFVSRGDRFVTCVTRPGCISNGNALESWGLVEDPDWRLTHPLHSSVWPAGLLPICLPDGAPKREGYETMPHRICPWVVHAMYPGAKVVKRG